MSWSIREFYEGRVVELCAIYCVALLAVLGVNIKLTDEMRKESLYGETNTFYEMSRVN